MIPPRLLLATSNEGKVAELGELARRWGPIEVLSLVDVPPVTFPPEGMRRISRTR